MRISNVLTYLHGFVLAHAIVTAFVLQFPFAAADPCIATAQ